MTLPFLSLITTWILPSFPIVLVTLLPSAFVYEITVFPSLSVVFSVGEIVGKLSLTYATPSFLLTAWSYVSFLASESFVLLQEHPPITIPRAATTTIVITNNKTLLFIFSSSYLFFLTLVFFVGFGVLGTVVVCCFFFFTILTFLTSDQSPSTILPFTVP